MKNNNFLKFVNRFKRWQDLVLAQDNDNIELFSDTGKSIILSKAEILTLQPIYTNNPNDKFYKVRHAFTEKYKFISEHGIMISVENEQITYISANMKKDDKRYRFKMRFSYHGENKYYVNLDPGALVAMTHDGNITSDAAKLLDKHGIIPLTKNKALDKYFYDTKQYEKRKVIGSVELHHIENYQSSKGLENNIISNTCFLTTPQHKLVTKFNADKNLDVKKILEQLEKVSFYDSSNIVVFEPNDTKTGKVLEYNPADFIQKISKLPPDKKIIQFSSLIKAG